MIGSVRKRGSARAIARKRGEAVRSEVRNSLPPASLTHLNLVTRFGIHSRPPLLTAGLITCHSSLARVTRNSPPGAPPDPFLISRFPYYLMDSGSCIPVHSTLIPQRSTQLVRLITCHSSLAASPATRRPARASVGSGDRPDRHGSMQGGVAEPRRFEFARRFSPRFARYGNSGSCIPAHSTLIPQRSTQLVRLITCHLSLVTGRVTRYSPPRARFRW